MYVCIYKGLAGTSDPAMCADESGKWPLYWGCCNCARTRHGWERYEEGGCANCKKRSALANNAPPPWIAEATAGAGRASPSIMAKEAHHQQDGHTAGSPASAEEVRGGRGVMDAAANAGSRIKDAGGYVAGSASASISIVSGSATALGGGWAIQRIKEGGGIIKEGGGYAAASALGMGEGAMERIKDLRLTDLDPFAVDELHASEALPYRMHRWFSHSLTLSLTHSLSRARALSLYLSLSLSASNSNTALLTPHPPPRSTGAHHEIIYMDLEAKGSTH